MREGEEEMHRWLGKRYIILLRVLLTLVETRP